MMSRLTNGVDKFVPPRSKGNDRVQFTRRMMDVLNQCKYLASKQGMSLNELRKSLREDEARQRDLIRKQEHQPQMTQLVNYSGGVLGEHPAWNLGGLEPVKKDQKDPEDNTDDMMNLLYFASKTDEKMRPGTTVIRRHCGSGSVPPPPPSRRGGSSGLIAGEMTILEDNKLRLSSSEEEMSGLGPVRKMGSHDIQSLRKAEDYSTDDEQEDSELEPRPVVSPLLKKVETAFADLQKSDSLFGNRDDFGQLFERIL